MTPFPHERPALCDKVLRFGFACPGRLRFQIIGDLVLEACDFCLAAYHVQTTRDPHPIESENAE